MIIEVDLYYQIRTLYNEGESIRSIAKRLGLSRQTVKKYCEGNTHPVVRKRYNRTPNVITDDIKQFILCCFAQDKLENLTKQKHTAKRIYDRLVDEKKFLGSYSAIRDADKVLRAEASVPPQADMPLEYEPGDAIQIDWGEATVYLDHQKRKVAFFCGRLCYSCDIFVQAFYSQNLESFLEAQQQIAPTPNMVSTTDKCSIIICLEIANSNTSMIVPGVCVQSILTNSIPIASVIAYSR
ncbi:MAG: helix-turn-helix domain-containing protein [Lachnospiraceae bacterium]|nr:helix-turn-helix domain-containing protein [Lachnospiraceae bacterium]